MLGVCTHANALGDPWRLRRSPEEVAAKAVLKTLFTPHRLDFEGLVDFDSYGGGGRSDTRLRTLPPKTKYHMTTLPVDARAVVDGDGMTVFVDSSDPREFSLIPWEVESAFVHRSEARARRDFKGAERLHQKIIDSGYRVLHHKNREVLARKYRIRMRGIDAPETKMEYGRESQEELVKIVAGKSLEIFVYNEDHYGRLVGGVYCEGRFVQESMLKTGMAWPYATHDQRPELARWQDYARDRRIGLWASSNPEKPWDWRRMHPRD